jgi:hypothetical protein
MSDDQINVVRWTIKVQVEMHVQTEIDRHTNNSGSDERKMRAVQNNIVTKQHHRYRRVTETLSLFLLHAHT